MTTRVKSAASSEGYVELEAGLTAEEDRLFTAIAFGKLHRVTALLPHLRSTEVRDDFGNTALLHAARHARDDQVKFLLKLLLQRGSDVNAQDDAGLTSLMHLVRQRNRVDAVRTLMRCRHCDPNLGDKDGNTALMYAARAGDVEAMNVLLFLPGAAKAASVDVRNNEGLTALDWTVKEKRAECCRLLVEEGKADTRTVKDAEAFNKLLASVLSRIEDAAS